jgi:hypothetical protein
MLNRSVKSKKFIHEGLKTNIHCYKANEISYNFVTQGPMLQNIICP